MGRITNAASEVGSATKTVVHAGLDVVATVPYTIYYVNYQVGRGVNEVGDHLGAGQYASRAFNLFTTVPGRAVGLGGDTLIDWIKGHGEQRNDLRRGSAWLHQPNNDLHFLDTLSNITGSLHNHRRNRVPIHRFYATRSHLKSLHSFRSAFELTTGDGRSAVWLSNIHNIRASIPELVPEVQIDVLNNSYGRGCEFPRTRSNNWRQPLLVSIKEQLMTIACINAPC